MAKILKKKISKNVKFILNKIDGKIIVRCPFCKTKFFRPSAIEERCNVCETVQTFKACA